MPRLYPFKEVIMQRLRADAKTLSILDFIRIPRDPASSESYPLGELARRPQG